jgi:DNA processing protein
MHEWKKWPIQKKDKLYYRGEWDEKLFEKTIVVVGSRKMTRYGREMVAKFMPDLVANKLTIISGFMYGIDSEAHRSCIEMGGKTIAVLGSGLNYLTTVDNDGLYADILNSGGLVISEFEPEFKATVWSFPMRNRVVARMATEGILVVEAGMKSGSLITARLGNEMSKKVFAIPGQINSATSEGTNWLIKNNQAKMVTEVGDIINGAITQEKLFEVSLNNEENMIYKLLECEPLTVDEIAKELGKSVIEISTTITKMSMNNLVNEEMGKIFLKQL